MAKIIKLPISAIKIDDSTQQRPLCNKTLAEYKALMGDGIEFPPVEVICDRMAHFMWDGWHRLEVAKALGHKTIRANVDTGTKSEAVWLSYGANKHGLQRQAGVKKEIIEKILGNPDWSKTPITKIAEHVGVSRRYVHEIKAAMEANSGQSDGVNTSQDEPHSEPVRADSIEVERDGVKYDMKTPKPKAPPAPVDQTGKELPKNLIKIFEQSSEIKTFVNELHAMGREVNQAASEDPELWSYYRSNPAKIDFENLRRQFTFALPYAVCRYCGGDGGIGGKCKVCKGLGFVNEMMFNSTPEELK